MNDVIARLRSAGYSVRTRKQWGSQQAGVYAERRRSKPVDFPVDFVFAHITVTKKHGDEGAREVEEIGVSRFGSGVSYNWLVDHETHAIYEGQPLDAKGTHTVNDREVPGFPENLNYVGHAVALIGMPGDEFCDECAELFAAIQAAERIEGVLRDSAGYLPHSTFAAKDCPGDNVRDALAEINAEADRMVADGYLQKGTRVTRVKRRLAKLVNELDKAPKKRKLVHEAKDELTAIVEKLPER